MVSASAGNGSVFKETVVDGSAFWETTGGGCLLPGIFLRAGSIIFSPDLDGSTGDTAERCAPIEVGVGMWIGSSVPWS